MKNIAKTVAVLLLAVLPVFAFSQEKKKLFREVREIVSVENDGSSDVMVFSMPENGQDHYYLSVGTLGAGDRIIQFNIDPFSTLFIPLGDTLAEAQERLDGLKALVKQPKGTTIETVGSLAVGYPNDELNEPVTVRSYRFLFARKLEFSVKRGDNLRATYISKTDITAMASGVKLYRKLHPSQL